MARPPRPVPLYRKHPSRDLARCFVAGKWITLGPYNSEKSRREYERICAELRASSSPLAATTRPADRPHRTIPLGVVAAAFLDHAERHYRRTDGKPTTETRECRAAFAHLRPYANSPAAEFGPLALQAVRQRMIDAGWCRGRINKMVDRVKRMFKWAAAQELVPAAVWQALAAVGGLQKGRSAARETEPVRPVAAEHVLATLPYLSRHVATMVVLQMLTGMRPGHAFGLTLGQIDRTGDVWVYTPKQHKTLHRGKGLTIPIGPRAQKLLAEFLGARLETLGPDEPVFSPKLARGEAYAAMRARRKTPVQPSQASRRKRGAGRIPGEWYDGPAYAHAVAKGVERANRRLVEAGVDVDQHVPHWHPNQVRHDFATKVRKKHGLEAAGAMLGHSKMSATEVYAERDVALAIRIAGEMG